MKVLEVLDAELVLVDLEVNLGKKKQNSPTLCARYKGKYIPLSTPDGRPILMKEDNALWGVIIVCFERTLGTLRPLLLSRNSRVRAA